LSALPAVAQSDTGSVEGVVSRSDAKGVFIESAQIEIREVGTKPYEPALSTTKTDRTGHYRLDLRPGMYDIYVNAQISGCTTGKVGMVLLRSVTITAGKTTKLDFQVTCALN
jgi:hypothetical protein